MFDGVPTNVRASVSRPQSFIHGLARPSTDLLLEEVFLREESLEELLQGLKAKQELLARTPSIWPSPQPSRDISSSFGMRVHPVLKKVRHHDGIDITARHGSVVVTTAKGTVKYSGWDVDFGNIIKIDHGIGIETWYAHLSKRAVVKGESVTRGQVIGNLGSTGRMSTGPHIHYEVRINGKPVDSAQYLVE